MSKLGFWDFWAFVGPFSLSSEWGMFFPKGRKRRYNVGCLLCT